MLRKLKTQFKNMDSNPELVDYVNKRLSSVQDLIPSEDGVRWNVRFSQEGHRNKGNVYRVQAQLKTARKNFGAQASGSTPQEAIDELKNELQKKVTHHKDKKITLWRKSALRAKQLLRRNN